MTNLVFLAVIVLMQGMSLSADYCGDRYQPLPSINTSPCSESPLCDVTTIYRTYDGTCSNLEHPSDAKAGNPFIRVQPALYDDGRFEPRRGVNGYPLPKVRQLSYKYFPDRFVPDPELTLNLMQWGQLVAHDTTHILNRQTEEQKAIKCCSEDNQLLPEDSLPIECLPVEVCPNDPFFSRFGVSCLDFVRAQITLNGTCQLFPIEQKNVVTSVIDAGFVYGNDETTARSLRTLQGGELRVQLTPDLREFPPNSNQVDIDCQNPPQEQVCYVAGDDRVNQNLDITVYQVILLRLHNHIARQLVALNPPWQDERVYQETRRIIWAVIQHITFKQFLPVILGEDYMCRKGLDTEPICGSLYDPCFNPSTYNEYGGAAYRSFHTLVPRQVVFYNADFQPYRTIFLDRFYFRPTVIQEPGSLDGMLRGLAAQPMQQRDTYFSATVTNYLLRRYNASFGNDLESTDIQRGRDMGLPTYNDMRELCGLPRASIFTQLADVMDAESILKLTAFYKSVDDIDLFVGGMFEELLPGTLVGPTFQCVIGEQFYVYSRGDRFYYENRGLPTSFTEDQLSSIYQTSVAWIFCVTGDHITSMNRDTFRRPSPSNPILPCSLIPGLDLEPWRELPDSLRTEI